MIIFLKLCVKFTSICITAIPVKMLNSLRKIRKTEKMLDILWKWQQHVCPGVKSHKAKYVNGEFCGRNGSK